MCLWRRVYYAYSVNESIMLNKYFAKCQMMTGLFPNCFFLFKKSRVPRRSSIQIWLLLFTALIPRCMGPTEGPSGAHRSQVGPMLAPWTLLSGWESSLLNSFWLTHPCAWFHGKHHYLLHISFISARCQRCAITTTSLKYHRDSKIYHIFHNMDLT